MTKEALILGITGIALGIGILIKTQTILPALIPTIIGIALIILRKEENKIEERLDTPKKHKRKNDNLKTSK